MKKILAFLISGLFILLLTACNVSNIHDFILVDNHEFITMVTSADFPPFEFMTIDEQERPLIAGIDIELGKAIAYDLNKNLRVINRGFDFLIEEVRQGNADMAISALTPTDARRLVVDFSNNYFETYQVLVIRDDFEITDLEDLNKPSVNIGVQLASTQHELVMADFPNAHTVTRTTVDELFELLSVSHMIDALVVELSVAQVRLNSGVFPNLVIYDEYLDESVFAVAIGKGNTELLASINATITRVLADGTFDQWYELWSNYESPGQMASIWTWANMSLLLGGFVFTIIFSILAIILGFILAFIPALMRISNIKILRWIATWYVDIIRGTPLLVQMLIIFTIMALRMDPIGGFDIGAFIPGLVAMVINCSAYMSEIIRTGIQSVDKGQNEAARSLGLDAPITLRKVILPQALKKMIPTFGNEFVTIIKETSIFMYIGVAELMFQVRLVQVRTFRTLEVFLVAALLYLIVTIPLSKLMGYLERKSKYESKA